MAQKPDTERKPVAYRSNLTLERLKELLGTNVIFIAEYKSNKRIDRDLDLGIEKLVRRAPYGSGYDFVQEARDLSFSMPTRVALDAARRVKLAFPKVKVRFL